MWGRFASRRIGYVVIAFVAFTIINWGTWRVLQQPDLGFIWNRGTGVVYRAPNHPIIMPGDKVLTIDKVPVSESDFPFYHWQRGDIVSVEYQREEVRYEVQLRYESSAPIQFLTSHLLLLAVSLSFWVVGLWVSQAQRTVSQVASVFFAFCMLVAVITGVGSVVHPSWVAFLTVTSIWFVVPVAIHLHLLFPKSHSGSWTRIAIPILYLIAGLGSFLDIAFQRWPSFFQNMPPFVQYIDAVGYSPWIVFGMAVSVGLLLRSYFLVGTPLWRRQVGIVLISYLFGVGPLLFFTTLPTLFNLSQFLASEIAVLFFGFIPIGYGYAISSYKLMNVESYVSRSASVLLPLVLLSYLYLFIQNLTQKASFLSSDQISYLNLGIFILAVLAFNPIKVRLRGFIDQLFYDGWYDYSSVVDAVTYQLSESPDLDTLTEALISSIQSAMRVHWSVLLLHRPSQEGMVPQIAGDQVRANLFEQYSLQSDGDLINTLFEAGVPMASRDLKKIQVKKLGNEEVTLLSYPETRLWVPIEGIDRFRAVLVLGPKYGGDAFDHEDMAILKVVAKQASIALKNAQLIEELAEKAEESDRYQRQVVSARFEERKRIARNVHDDFIQALVGFKYRISDVNGDDLELETQLTDLIKTARQICQDLRPPALDLGLIPGIRSIVRQFEMDQDIPVVMRISGQRDIDVDDNIGICLIQCTKEALSNVAKHAQADQVEIFLNFASSEVSLLVKDNGVGFEVPERIGTLMLEDHFGLVGMREHADLIQGDFILNSEPSEGTCLQIIIPTNG